MKLFKKEVVTIHDGVGFIQGTGLIVKATFLDIFGFRFITDLYIDPGMEYTRNLRNRITADAEQSAREKK